MGEPEEFDDIRSKRRMQEKKAAEAKQAQEQLKAALRAALETEAYDRLTNVQHVHAQLFLAAAQHLLGLYKRVGRRLSDEEVRAVLARIRELSETKTEIRFARK